MKELSSCFARPFARAFRRLLPKCALRGGTALTTTVGVSKAWVFRCSDSDVPAEFILGRGACYCHCGPDVVCAMPCGHSTCLCPTGARSSLCSGSCSRLEAPAHLEDPLYVTFNLHLRLPHVLYFAAFLNTETSCKDLWRRAECMARCCVLAFETFASSFCRHMYVAVERRI